MHASHKKNFNLTFNLFSLINFKICHFETKKSFSKKSDLKNTDQFLYLEKIISEKYKLDFVFKENHICI